MGNPTWSLCARYKGKQTKINIKISVVLGTAQKVNKRMTTMSLCQDKMHKLSVEDPVEDAVDDPVEKIIVKLKLQKKDGHPPLLL